MKRLKTLTKKERKAAKELADQQPKLVRKARKIKPMLTVDSYLERQANMKLMKAHHRKEKRDAKKGVVHAH